MVVAFVYFEHKQISLKQIKIKCYSVEYSMERKSTKRRLNQP